MLRLAATVLALTFVSTAFAQVLSSQQQATSETSSSKTESAPPENAPNPQKSSPVKHKLDEALPDCVNLIFYHGCRNSSARQQDAEEKEQKKLAEAAERCKQLTAALPAAFQPHASPTVQYCTPEDVIAADHDVDVGDFNFHDKNYKGAEMRYRSALQRLPGEPVATLHLARLLEKTGRKSEALEQYQIYLSWKPTGKEAEEASAAIKRLQSKMSKK